MEEHQVGDAGSASAGSARSARGRVWSQPTRWNTRTASPAGSTRMRASPTWMPTASTPPSSIRASGCSPARSRTPNSPPRRAAPTTAGSPITASPIPTGCSASRCCRCSRSSWRSRRCASRARNSGFRGGFIRPNPYSDKMIHDPIATSRSGQAAEDLDFAIGFHEGASSGMPTVGVDRFEGRGARHIISHTMEMMLACMSVIWGGVCERHPKIARRLPRIGRRLDRALARPHGPPFRRSGL